MQPLDDSGSILHGDVMSLEALIKDRIKQHGPLTVADYMKLALTHEELGYYTTRDPFGQNGDFITAPEISQIFGELLGAWVAMTWQQMGEPEMVLVELGPGRGTLMQDMLRACSHMPTFHESVCVVMMESSPKLRRFQQATLKNIHPRISWQDTLDDLPELPIMLIANEFFDALPVRQYVKTPQGLKEKMVSIDESGNLSFTIKEMGIQLVKGGAYSGDEIVVESSPETRAVITRIAHHMRQFGGAGMIIDYGYTGGSRGNTLQAVKKHGFHPVLENPGEADITAHVDFDMLQETLEEQGISTYGPVEQGTLLQRLGAELRAEMLLRDASPDQQDQIVSGLTRLMAPHEMGELFKALAFSSEDINPVGFDDDDYSDELDPL